MFWRSYCKKRSWTRQTRWGFSTGICTPVLEKACSSLRRAQGVTKYPNCSRANLMTSPMKGLTQPSLRFWYSHRFSSSISFKSWWFAENFWPKKNSQWNRRTFSFSNPKPWDLRNCVDFRFKHVKAHFFSWTFAVSPLSQAIKLGSLKPVVHYDAGWQPWLNMTIMLWNGMIMVIHTRQGIIMARSWHRSHLNPTWEWRLVTHVR